MKPSARYLNGLHIVGLPKILAEKETARFRQWVGDIDQHFALVNTQFPKFDRALETSLPMQLKGRLADRKNRHRYQHAAVYFVWMVPEMAFQLCHASEKMEDPPLLLPHRIILDQLGIGDTPERWLSAEEGLHSLLHVANHTRLLGGRFLDEDRLWRYATDWPYALAGLEKLVGQLHRWRKLNEDEQAQCQALFWAVSLCLMSQEAGAVQAPMLQAEWGLSSCTAQAFQRAYAQLMCLPESLFAPPSSLVKGVCGPTNCATAASTPTYPDALLAALDQDPGIICAHLAAALFAATSTPEAEAPTSEAVLESNAYAPLPVSTVLTRLSQLPERLALEASGQLAPKVSPQSCRVRAWPLPDASATVSPPLVSGAVETLLAEITDQSASILKHHSRVALWACWVYEVCVALASFAAVLRQHALLTTPREQALDALKVVVLNVGRVPKAGDAGYLKSILQQSQDQLAQVMTEVQGVAVLEDREARLMHLDALRGVLDYFGQGLIKLMFSLEAEARAQAWAALMAEDQPTLPPDVPEWFTPELSTNLIALQRRLAEKNAEQALILFPVLAQEIDAARQHILSAQVRRETQVDETLAALHALLSQTVARWHTLPTDVPEAVNDNDATPEPSPCPTNTSAGSTLQKELAEFKKRLHDRERELNKRQQELTDNRMETARLKQECLRLEKAQVGPLHLPGGQTMSALAEGVVRTMTDTRLSSVLKAAAKFCQGQVEVLESAYDSANLYQRVEYSPTEVMDKLLRLSLEYLPRFLAGGDNKAREVFGQIYSAKESDSVMNDVKMRSQREFKVKGQTKLFLKHLRLNSYLRLYFEVDQTHGKIVIAYLGEHLDCAITA